MSDKKILAVESIEKEFGTVRAVDRLSFHVRQGEIFGFLGPNGAGKSTTVRMLVGILQPDAGEIRFTLPGSSPATPDPSQLGYLPEDRGLYPDVPVIRTLTYMGVIRGMDRREARAAGLTWLERLGLAERANDKLDSLSKGNQQKVQFIVAVIHRPAFAILDEPFSGLDPVNQELFLDILRELRESGTTVLLSAHQMQLVERIADRVLLMNGGREVLHGSIQEVKAQATAGGRIFLRLAGESDPASLTGFPAVEAAERSTSGELAVELRGDQSLSPFLAAVAARHEIRSIRSEDVSLHDIFVQRVAGDKPSTSPATSEAGS